MEQSSGTPPGPQTGGEAEPSEEGQRGYRGALESDHAKWYLVKVPGSMLRGRQRGRGEEGEEER